MTAPDEALDLDPEPIDMSTEAMRRRAEQGPLEILKMPDDDNPGLPPEVWQHPPKGHALPE